MADLIIIRRDEFWQKFWIASNCIVTMTINFDANEYYMNNFFLMLRRWKTRNVMYGHEMALCAIVDPLRDTLRARDVCISGIDRGHHWPNVSSRSTNSRSSRLPPLSFSASRSNWWSATAHRNSNEYCLTDTGPPFRRPRFPSASRT